MEDDANNDFQYEEYYVDTNPSEEEIREYAKFIGLDPDKDPDLLYIAAEGISAPLPENWKLYRNKNNENEYFFFNSETGESINDHPLDQYYINLAKQKLEEKYAKASKKEKNKGKKHKKRHESPPPADDNPFLIDDDDPVISEEPPTIKTNNYNNNNNSPTTNNIPVVDMTETDYSNKNKSSSHKHRSKSHHSSGNNNQVDDNEIRQVSEKNNDQIRLLQEEFENKKAELERDHQRIINDLKNSQRNEQQQEENILREIQDRRRSKENELSSMNNEISLTKDQQKSQIDILKSQHDQFIETLKQQNTDDINHLKESFEQTKKQLQEEQNKLIDELKKKNEDEINKIKKDHEQEKNELTSKFKDEIAEMKKQHKSKIEKMRAKHERQLSEIRAKAANHLETEKKKYESPNSRQQYQKNYNSSPKSPMSYSSNIASPQKHQNQTEHDLQKESIEALNRFNEYTKNELDKKRREYENQLSKLMTSQSEEIAKKHAEHVQLVNKLDQIKQQYNEEIRKTQENAEAEKRNIMRQMQRDVSSAKRKELKEKKRSFICQTQRIVSIRGKDSIDSSHKNKLKRSKSIYLSIIDDLHLKYSPPHTVFQIYSKKITNQALQKDKAQVFDNLEEDDDNASPSKQRRNEYHRNDSDDDNFNTNTRPTNFGSNSNAKTFIEISENDHQKIKYSFQKIQQQFDSNAKKMENKMDTIYTDINAQVKELRSFMQEENRAMNKSTLEFHQQILDITRNFHNSLSELETEHYSAFSAMNSIRNKAENIPQPTQIIVAPPLSPQPFYSFVSPEYQQAPRFKRARRYDNYNRAREVESYYDSDYD